MSEIEDDLKGIDVPTPALLLFGENIAASEDILKIPSQELKKTFVA